MRRRPLLRQSMRGASQTVRSTAPACVCLVLLVTSAVGALPAAGATPLFGADQRAVHTLPVDDDVHASAADAAAKWQQRINRMFGSASPDARSKSKASGLFGTAVPGISHLLQADVADAAEGSPAEQRRRAAALPCLHDDGSVAGGAAAGCRPGTLEKPLDPESGGKAALLAHHMYQQRDDVVSAGAEPLQRGQQQQEVQQQQQPQQPGKQQGQHGSQHRASNAALGHSLLQGGLAVAEAGLIVGGPSLKAAAGARTDMQPLAVHSRIVDRALDDHLQQLDTVDTQRLPVADGPDSTLRGWEAADEGGALGFGFRHLPVDQVHQQRSDGNWWFALMLRFGLAASCASLVATLYVVRCRVASQRQQVGARYGDGKRLPLLSTPVPAVASAKGNDVMQPGTPDTATCRPRRLEADLDMASPCAPCLDSSPHIALAHDKSVASGKPGSGRQFHLQAFASGLTILPPQPPFATPLSSLATSCSYTDPSPLGLGSPLSLASPSPSPQQLSSAQSPPRQHVAKHVRWDAPSPEWPVLSPGVPRSFRG